MLSRCQRTMLATLAIIVMEVFLPCRTSLAAFHIGDPELDSWSDMAFASGVTGGFSAGTQQLTVSATPSNDLEIGSQFGPSNPGRHYGPSGPLGGPFSATLSVSGVVIQPSGAVTNGGSLSITFNGGAPGSLGSDYGIVAGNALLTGFVVAVGLDATGADTLDIAFKITGGALQNINGALGTNFSPSNLGILRFKSPGLPSDFSTSFNFASNATLDVLGTVVPEFKYTTLVCFAGIFVLASLLKGRVAGRSIAEN